MSDLPIHHFRGPDGADLVYREMGEGRPLVLIHGYFSTATVNWIRYGHAATLAGHGYRVIMPDLRGHGDSAKAHEAAAYPPDILAADGFALIDHLGLTRYDLGGYSLGGRTTIRMLALGATPDRAIVAAMGLEGVVHPGRRNAHFRQILTTVGPFQRGSPQWLAQAFLKTVRGDPEALLHVLATSVDTPREALTQIATPTLVVVGAADDEMGDAKALAAVLPRSRFVVVTGNHMSAVTKPDLGAVMAAYLDQSQQGAGT